MTSPGPGYAVAGAQPPGLPQGGPEGGGFPDKSGVSGSGDFLLFRYSTHLTIT